MRWRFKFLIVSVLAVFMSAWPAYATSIRGRDISTIPDILRHARGLMGKDVPLELRKDSLLRLHDNGEIDLLYGIGNSDRYADQYVNLGPISGYSSGFLNRDNGFSAALAKRAFSKKKILISSSKLYTQKVASSPMTGGYDSTNWYYDLYFTAISKDEEGTFSQSRFGAWRYPVESRSGNSAYIKDIKAGIFVDGFDGELVVAASVETTEDYGMAHKDYYKDKTAGTRLDFWALFPNASGDVQYKKLDNLTLKESSFDAAPLNGILNVPDNKWNDTIWPGNDLSYTTASPYMIIKTATGDFNNDGFENEVAVLAADRTKIYMWVYQLEYSAGTFTIKTISDRTEIFTFRNPNYITKWSYNGWNRSIGADILAGDFDGDGKTEIAVIFQGDIPQSERNAMYFGGTVKTIHTNMYKWDNSTGNLKATTYEANDYKMTLERPFKQIYTDVVDGYVFRNEVVRGYRRRLQTSWGGFKATVIDINGDGQDEIAFAGYRSDMFYNVKDTDYRNFSSGADRHAEYKVFPYVSLVFMDTDGKLKSGRIYEGDPIINNRYTTYNGFDEDRTENWNAFKLEEYLVAPLAKDAEVYPLAEREIGIAAGAFFGQTGFAKERDDLALRLYGGKLILFKSDGTTLKPEMNRVAYGTSALAVNDFAGEGIELGSPIYTKNLLDRTYMAVIQAPPYHVDTVSEDGSVVTVNPVNFSYTRGAQVSYGKTDTNAKTQTAKFDLHSSIETIYALDQDTAKNVIGGVKKVKDVYGAVKSVIDVLSGTSAFANLASVAKKIDGGVSPVFKFLEKLPDKIESVKQSFDTEIQEQTMFKVITAPDVDTFGYVEANRYIWRYPIITNPAPNLHTMSDDAKFLTKQDFITFTMYDDPTPSTSINTSDYQPTHENGNLFSYPSAIGNIEGYGDKQKELSTIENIQFGASVSGGNAFTKITQNEKTESQKVQKGYLTTLLSIVDSIADTNFSQVPKGETGSTYTRKESTSERIDWVLPRVAAAPLDRGYTVHYQAYVAEDGAITCGFAVSGFSDRLNLFNSESIYNRYPDPAFPLPYKFKVSDSKLDLPSFMVNTSRNEAMEIRGVRIYAIDFNRYTSSRLLKGARYRIEIPLYNASFLPANNVKVNLYWVRDRKEASLQDKTLIGTQYVNMTGWSNAGDNKAWAKFEFTPEMDAGQQFGRYHFYALIDPDGTMTEVHENRDLTKDSGGNNEGYFEFSAESFEIAAATNAFYAGGFRASVEEKDIISPVMTFGGYSSWTQFFNNKIANTSGPVEVEVSIANKMNVTIPRLELVALYRDPEKDGNDQAGCVNFAKEITLFPNETYTCSVTIDDRVADEMRRLGVNNTLCGYTPTSLYELLYGNETVSALSGDVNPALEVFTQEFSDDTGADATQYYDTAMTQTYELSHDFAVFWRIGGISDFITETGVDETTVKTSAAMAATSEDFSLAWSPSESVKTASTQLKVSAIPGTTRAGAYAFTIQVSEDGTTWTDKKALMFGTSDRSSSSGNTGRVSSSSGGCEAGYSALALMALAVMIRRKIR